MSFAIIIKDFEFIVNVFDERVPAANLCICISTIVLKNDEHTLINGRNHGELHFNKNIILLLASTKEIVPTYFVLTYPIIVPFIIL